MKLNYLSIVGSIFILSSFNAAASTAVMVPQAPPPMQQPVQQQGIIQQDVTVKGALAGIIDYEQKTGDLETFAFEKSVLQQAELLADTVPQEIQKQFSAQQSAGAMNMKVGDISRELQAVIVKLQELSNQSRNPQVAQTATQMMQGFPQQTVNQVPTITSPMTRVGAGVAVGTTGMQQTPGLNPYQQARSNLQPVQQQSVGQPVQTQQVGQQSNWQQMSVKQRAAALENQGFKGQVPAATGAMAPTATPTSRKPPAIGGLR